MSKIDTVERTFMSQALELAKKAARLNETPVGAVLVLEGKIIGTGFNRMEADHDPTAHAEMAALRQATGKAGTWRLPSATLYVTLEPCIMCASALIHARIKRVVYGARDHRWGGFGSLFDFAHDPRINHEIEVVSGIMEEEAAKLLRSFFKNVRNRSGY